MDEGDIPQEGRCLPGAPASMSHVAGVWRRLRSALSKASWRRNERTRLLGNVFFRQDGGDVFPESLKVLARHAKLKYPGIDSVYGPFYDTEDCCF